MAFVVFLRGMNVGGHRRFRPSILAKELGGYDAVNVGAAGTLVIRRPGDMPRFLSELFGRLPQGAEAAICPGRDLLLLEKQQPFREESPDASTVRFVSVLSDAARCAPSIPFSIPAEGESFVRVITANSRFVCGVYRRHMKTIGYLGQIDRLFGTTATTRNWNTILAVVEILKSGRNENRS